jgi:hypothetical protein
VFQGVFPPAQFWFVPDRMREAPTTAPVDENRIRDAPPPDDADTSEFDT